MLWGPRLTRYAVLSAIWRLSGGSLAIVVHLPSMRHIDLMTLIFDLLSDEMHCIMRTTIIISTKGGTGTGRLLPMPVLSTHACSPLLSSYDHCDRQLLLLFFTPDSKPIFSTNPPHQMLNPRDCLHELCSMFFPVFLVFLSLSFQFDSCGNYLPAVFLIAG